MTIEDALVAIFVFIWLQSSIQLIQLEAIKKRLDNLKEDEDAEDKES